MLALGEKKKNVELFFDVKETEAVSTAHRSDSLNALLFGERGHHFFKLWVLCDVCWCL